MVRLFFAAAAFVLIFRFLSAGFCEALIWPLLLTGAVFRFLLLMVDEEDAVIPFFFGPCSLFVPVALDDVEETFPFPLLVMTPAFCRRCYPAMAPLPPPNSASPLN